MMKTGMIQTAFLTAVLGVALAYGSPRPETSTYVDGNVTSLKPNTGGTLVFSDNNSMTFRTGVADVAVPYANILKAELGATQTHAHDDPAYKVWLLPRRLHKTETQLLTVQFKNGLGEHQTMTLALAKDAAPGVLATIEERTGKTATDGAEKTSAKSVAATTAKTPDSKKSAEWWGDSFWKTDRNQAQWGANANNTNANSNGK